MVQPLASEFSAYGLSHWVVLAVFAVGAVAVVAIGRRERTGNGSSHFGLAFGWVTLDWRANWRDMLDSLGAASAAARAPAPVPWSSPKDQ